MENTGEYLKQEREKQQKTVSDIVSSTRISKTVIEAIERNDYKALPPLQYLKGLLRIYAKELNLDAEEIVASYEKVFQGKRTAEFKLLREIDSTRAEKKQYTGFLIILLLLFLAAGMYMVQNYYEEGKRTFETVYPEITTEILSEKEEIEEETIAESLEAEEEPVVEEETAAESLEAEEEPVVEEEEEVIEQVPVRQTAPVDEKFIISFSAKELTWIKLEVDDEPAFDIMLREGESYRQSAQNKMEVRIGNSAGVAVFFNDKPVELNGEHGKPVDFVFPDDALVE